MKSTIKRMTRKTGVKLSKFPVVAQFLGNTYSAYNIVRRMKIVSYFNIDTLFDIGANVGQYALDMRRIGYSKRIISFEPLKSAFKELEKASVNDKNWLIHNYALGNENIKSIINISNNSVSSSILNILPFHLKNAPDAKYIAQEEIDIKKIDTIFNSFCNLENSVMIKIDTQGYEKNVLEGAIESLKNIKIIQLEMSLIPFYEDEIPFVEMINYLENMGFQLFSLENGYSDSNTGQLLQVDGIFIQRSLISK